MKKLTKLLALTMTGGMLLVGCGDTEDVNEDLPDVEEGLEDTEEGVEDTGDELDEEMEDDAE